MTPREALALIAPPSGPEYVCATCGTAWHYVEVRHVLCCPECAGGLLRRPEADADTGQRSGRSG